MVYNLTCELPLHLLTTFIYSAPKSFAHTNYSITGKSILAIEQESAIITATWNYLPGSTATATGEKCPGQLHTLSVMYVA